MQKARVTVPLADLRREPKHLPQDYAHNPLRESQLLEGEKILIHEHVGEWLRIEAVEQPRFSKGQGWHGYPGWIHQSEAQVVDEFPPEKEPVEFSREKLVEDSKKFLGVPYLWGGRSVKGPDCSSLVQLLYREQGVTLPRDAHDQWLWTQPIERENMLPGDLIYLGKGERMTHVVIFMGDQLLEAPETGKCVRLIDVPEFSGDQVLLPFRKEPSRFSFRSCTPLSEI